MIPMMRGIVSKQAHVGIPDGLVEEEYARNGFSGSYAHLYRKEAPTNWTHIDGPCRPRAYDLRNLGAETNFLSSRDPLLENEDVRISLFTLSKTPPYYFRNADAEDLYFVHKGSGRLETEFGPLNYTVGDYLLLPRGTVYRFAPKEASIFLSIESFSELKFPDRGMLGQHALFDPAVLEVPSPEEYSTAPGDYQVKIKREDEITTVHYERNPLNVVGWKGTLMPMRLNVKDIRPVLSDRYHLPPSAHSTFVGNRFVVCTFLPRPLENGDPQAMKVPFYHSNIDFDEVLFYHQGQFFSREGIHAGMLTFHPQGIPHGPQKKAIERSVDAKATNEVAVMIDTRRPLRISSKASNHEISNYWQSWK